MDLILIPHGEATHLLGWADLYHELAHFILARNPSALLHPLRRLLGDHFQRATDDAMRQGWTPGAIDELSAYKTLWLGDWIVEFACDWFATFAVLQYPNLENAWQASNGLRVSINEIRNRQREQAIAVADLVDHYIATELANDQVDGGKSHATKTVYRDFLTRWVKPAWGILNIRDVRTIAVERWLRQLLRVDGNPLAPSTKAKIRNQMSVLFNHAIRHEWLEQGRNPILLVRQSAKRQRIPEWLEPEELSALLSQLDPCFHLMVFLDAVTGLRRSELLALKWRDVEFENLQIIVQRSIYRNVVGNCKTEASKKPVPMDPILAAELWAWKQDSPYSQPHDWVFASPRTKGKTPYWPDILLSRVVRPAVARAGIKKHVVHQAFQYLIVGRHQFDIPRVELIKTIRESER
jgi:integrase